MNEFKEVPANKSSISTRKLLCGVGVNDSNYKTSMIIDGKTLRCPYYKRWQSMIVRCYSKEFAARRPTYSECYVCDEWLIFSNFKKWMEKQNWKGMDLDKDVLYQGNKVYGPSTCIFISPQLNLLLGNSKKSRGKYPQGVSFHKQTGKFRAALSVDGKNTHIGLFDSEGEAYSAYKKEKYNLIKQAASNLNDSLKTALLNYKIS